MRVLTVGHSTRSLEELLALLEKNEVRTLVDVRSYPGSRRYPHFNQEPLIESLSQAGYSYVHLKGLGGRRRHQERESLFPCIRVSAFRSYASVLGSVDWEADYERLLALERPCLMCAEAVWWRCHRRLIAEVLSARGHEVRHIVDASEPRAHVPWPEVAEYRDGRLYLCGQLAA